MKDVFIIDKIPNKKGIKVQLYQVDKLIFSLLANSTKPSAILDNIVLQTTSSLDSSNITVKDLLSKFYIQQCRRKIQIIILICATYRLAKSAVQKQLYTNATRQQVYLIALIILILEEGKYTPVVFQLIKYLQVIWLLELKIE